jgi:NADPH:quinone reductase-like Zn-dependent oxidoreductase
MRAVGFMNYGGPEVLEIYDLPETHAGPGQLRIRNRAATVNPTDIMSRRGMLSNQQKGVAPPYVPGMEAAGVVDEVGEGVASGVKVGDSVLGLVIPRVPRNRRQRPTDGSRQAAREAASFLSFDKGIWSIENSRSTPSPVA